MRATLPDRALNTY